MANYIAWYGKKRQRLAKREREFFTLLQTETNPKKLTDAADEIRSAHVRVLKSRWAELPPSEKNSAAVQNIDYEIALWLGFSAEQIMERYRSGRHGHVASRAVRHEPS